MLTLYKGQRTNYSLRVKLSDCKTIISPAYRMMFWFYIKLPSGEWVTFDIRQLQEPELLLAKDPNDRFRMIVAHELDLIKQFGGKNHEERLHLIAEKISYLSIAHFVSFGLRFRNMLTESN